ncbi:MAG TPA: methyltransferase domain-containing protein [Vicinamibacterales bacterium]|nr:methyltransferase domain-containing protein [Vicinamibacterales bacterium]
MTDLEQRRRFYAEELDAVCAFRSPSLVEAFAAVPRERYLPPGPWDVLSVADYTPVAVPPPRKTPDANPTRVYHNIGIAIDAERRLFNGHPGTLASWIDALELKAGGRVLHIGAGLGYYTAIMGAVVGPGGHVTAIEVDDALAASARANLAGMPWIDVRLGDGREGIDGRVDAILVNAGVTHARDEWLDALAVGGRMMLPITLAMPSSGTISKGFMMLVTRTGETEYAVRTVTIVAIYSAVGLRDEALNAALADSMKKSPMFPQVTRLRRDPHDPSPSCWLHGSTTCLSM